MPYVIVRKEDEMYVAWPGMRHSYTKYLESARTFETREAAENQCCGNEYVADVYARISGAG